MSFIYFYFKKIKGTSHIDHHQSPFQELKILIFLKYSE